MANTIPSRPSDEWFFAGLASSFPNITATTAREPYFRLAWPQPCKAGDPSQKVPGCKVFHPAAPKAASRAQDDIHPSVRVVPPPSPTPTVAVSVAQQVDIEAAPGEDAWAMREQVLVFQYQGTFHAVDHACPHRAYSLSWGQPFDIEDAGRVVGQAIRCKGHSFAFELSTGIGDRGEYRLGVWDVELRARQSRENSVSVGEETGETGGEREGKVAVEAGETEVWVRRRKRPGQDPSRVG